LCSPSARRTAPFSPPKQDCWWCSSNRRIARNCNRLSFEVAPNSDFGELARNLTADGITSELRNDCVPGMGQVLTFKDNKGTAIDLFKEWSYLGSHHQVSGIGPLKLGHVAFHCPDVRRWRTSTPR